MGFERRTYTLDFDEASGFEGLVIRARGMTVDEAVDLEYLLNLGAGLLARTAEGEEHRKQWFGLLDELFIEWNREDDGVPVPCDEKHMRLEEVSLLQTAVRQWLLTALTVSPPLPPGSENGSSSPEPFDLTEALSGSQPS